MGYFTWTDARKDPKENKNGGYSYRDKIQYGAYAKVVCPDDTEIHESDYEGYGIFGGKDVYELVVDWNKPYLVQIFNEITERRAKEGRDMWGAELLPIAEAYQNGDEEKAAAIAQQIKASGSKVLYCADEWKRVIGIAIACDDDNNAKIPYPIKITSLRRHVKYDELKPSWSCQ